LVIPMVLCALRGPASGEPVAVGQN
jgi:hypothetical protein